MPTQSKLCLNNSDIIVYAGLFRRLFAIIYDLFLLTAVWFIVAGIANALNSGKAIESDNPFYAFFILALISTSYLYFGWFWTHGGRTLGMQTWRLRLQAETHEDISWKQVSIRYLIAIVSWLFIGLGFFWALFNRKKQCWHDLIAHTVIIDQR